MFSSTQLIAALLLFVAPTYATASTARIDPAVHRALRSQGTANLIVSLATDASTVLDSIHESSFASRADLIAAMKSQLEAHATETQADLQRLLQQESNGALFTSTQSFWISNEVFVEGATPELIEKVMTMPGVKEIRQEVVFPLTVEPEQTEAPRFDATVEWGVERVAAPAIWATGNQGEHIVVANIDTGVRGTHEALKENFRGDYGWFDPEKKSAAPVDAHGHGTHTMGTIAGQLGIGVAPGATWMACKGCRRFGCPESDLLGCAQFMLCPTDTKGDNADCSKAPHVINNSWGGGQGRKTYENVITSWVKAGIVPVFSNGNSGPQCGTANSPADLPIVIGVGATDVNDTIASFSSKGPSIEGRMKPEISAPGHKVRSAYLTNDTAYSIMSGTSMAAPHLTGVVALLLSANPNMAYADVQTRLYHTADTETLVSVNANCGNVADAEYPNHVYGYGRVNAAKALQ